jgi:hypothetical protein
VDTAEAWRRYRNRNRKCSCERCFYCDNILDRHEHDHYPVPKRAGGTRVVAACLPCHDLKDRIFLNNWDITAAVMAWQELLAELPEQLLEILNLAERSAPELFALCSADLETRWDSLSPLARVAYAKMRCLYEDDLYRKARRDAARTSQISHDQA